MVRLNTQNLLVFGDVIDFQRPKPMVIGGEPGSSNNLPFDGLIMRGNDMKLTSTNKDKLYLVYENDVKIYLDILPEFAFEQIIFQLQFMIGISKKTDFSKLLTVYICTKDINLKSLKQNKSTKGYSPSLDCSYIINSTISSTVMLSEAKLLKDFLVLRFQTENSVTYVRFEKYDFAKLEIYLKGYSPDFVWMAQTDSNKIILCHFKYDAPNPFSLFVSDGELLQNLPTLNLDMYRQVRQKVFKAGSLIQEDGPVYLYLAMALKVKETSAKNNYRGSISFMKYEVFDNGAPPKVRLRGHNVFTADFLMNRRGDVCFLMNKMVILTEEIIQDDVDFDPVYEVRVYLIDLLNPEFQYEVPLKEYDVSNMMDSKVICSLENNLIIVQGFLEKGNLKRAINIFLSGDFQQAHKRILRISDKLAGDSCTLSCTSVYMVEACMNKSLEGKVPFNFKIQALVSPKVHFLYDPADFNPMALGSTTEVEIKARAGTKEASFKFIMTLFSDVVYPATIYQDKNTFATKVSHKSDGSSSSLREIHLGKMDSGITNFIDSEDHILRVELLKKDEAGNYVPAQNSQAVRLVERLSPEYKYPKDQTFKANSNDTFGGFERIVLVDNYLAVMSVVVQFQSLKSWISMYEFNSTSHQTILIRRFSISSVCEEMSFNYYENIHWNNEVRFELAIVCNNGTTDLVRLFRFGRDPKIAVQDFTDPEVHRCKEVGTVSVVVNKTVPQDTSRPHRVLVMINNEELTKMWSYNINYTRPASGPPTYALWPNTRENVTLGPSKFLM